MKPEPKNTAAHAPGKLRIIGGEFRGRVLNFPAASGLRPTGNRIRETLFNWLMPVLPGSRCLDLFAGSGALGLEALSRGATCCTFVELNAAAAHALGANIALLGCSKAKVMHRDGLKWLEQGPPAAYDLVFLDPPFTEALWQPAITALEARWLAPCAYIYAETPRNWPLDVPPNWRTHRVKYAGAVAYRLYERSGLTQPVEVKSV